jgi:hypothetical protein
MVREARLPGASTGRFEPAAESQEWADPPERADLEGWAGPQE